MRVTRLLVLACAALIVAAVRPAFAQGSLEGLIEAPANNSTVMEPFQVRGWAFWTGATGGSSGIDSVTVYGCPAANCPSPTFWGAATIGLARPDVAAAYNNPAGANSGFSFTVSGLAPGTYFVQVWTHNTANGYWLPFNTTFTATVPPEHVVEHPTANQALTQPFTISGWAIDANAPTGTGVDIVGSFAYPHVGSGEAPYVVGQAVYGDARTDVAAAQGQRFLNSGYHLAVSGQSPGEYMFVVSARSTTPGNPWTAHNINVTIDTPTVALTVNRGGTGTGAVSATGLTCPGGSNTQALPCGTSYALNTTVTLTAVPDAGSTFTGWNGACQTTQPACTVTLTGNRDVFATFAQTAGAVATYYHTDAIGSVRALSDQTGATVIRHDYLPFGEDTQPLTGDPMRFAGKELDPESALMNFEARYYRNTWARFTQVDPIGGSLTDPQSWSRYAYARNNPLRFVDPTGLTNIPIVIIHNDVGIGCSNIDGTGWCNSGGGSWNPPPRQLPKLPNPIRFPKPMPSHGKDGDSDDTGSSDGDGSTGKDPTTSTDSSDKPDCPAIPTAPPGADVNANMQQARANALWNPLWIPWFKHQVQYGGPWDYKTQGPQYEDFGNFNYGATGTAAFAPAFTLLRAAGWAQRNHPSSPQFPGDPGSLLSIFIDPFGGTAPYGDDPHDQQLIQQGIGYAKKGCGG